MSDTLTDTRLYEEIVIAGFGGQGIMLAGRLLAQTAMQAGLQVTYMPSYGAEVRGGTANTMVIIAADTIACPIINQSDSAIIMNKASLSKFAPRVRRNGLIVLNSSLVDVEPEVDDSITILKVPADDIAAELGSPRSANMVALGAYLQKRGCLTPDQAAQALHHVLAKRYHDMLPTNTNAIKRGAEHAANN